MIIVWFTAHLASLDPLLTTPIVVNVTLARKIVTVDLGPSSRIPFSTTSRTRAAVFRHPVNYFLALFRISKFGRFIYLLFHFFLLLFSSCGLILPRAALESQQCRYGPVRPDRYLLYADRMVSGVNQAAGCQAACDSERNFRCRSYSLHEQSSSTSSSSSVMSMVCSLSSSTSMALEVNKRRQWIRETMFACSKLFIVPLTLTVSTWRIICRQDRLLVCIYEFERNTTSRITRNGSTGRVRRRRRRIHQHPRSTTNPFWLDWGERRWFRSWWLGQSGRPVSYSSFLWQIT